MSYFDKLKEEAWAINEDRFQGHTSEEDVEHRLTEEEVKSIAITFKKFKSLGRNLDFILKTISRQFGDDSVHRKGPSEIGENDE